MIACHFSTKMSLETAVLVGGGDPGKIPVWPSPMLKCDWCKPTYEIFGDILVVSLWEEMIASNTIDKFATSDLANNFLVGLAGCDHHC